MRPFKATDHDGQPAEGEVVVQVRGGDKDTSRLQARLSTGARSTVRVAWWVARARRNDYVPFYQTPHLTEEEWDAVDTVARKLYGGLSRSTARVRLEAGDGE